LHPKPNLQMIKFPLNTKKVITVLCIAFAVLFILNLVTVIQDMYFVESTKDGISHYFYYAFNFNIEKNVPTYFSVLLLLLAAQSFFVITLFTPINTSLYIKYYWWQMSLIFLLLSLDEMTQIHENLEYITRHYIAVDIDGFFAFAWVIPMIGLLIMFGLYSIKFLMYIPKYLSKGYIIAGFLYVLGAVGFEMITAKIFSVTNNEENFYYYMAMSVEESLEMIGVIVLLYFNLKYIEELSTNNNGQ